jgi:DNA-directed RNA polymerase specialized sigma24 family protein
MNTTAVTNSSPDSFGSDAWYCAEVIAVLRRSIRRTGMSRHDVEDATSAAVERLLRRLVDTRRSYPNPHVYAAAVRSSATEDHFRRERAQRGQGARTVIGEDGAVAVRREIVGCDELLERSDSGAADVCEQVVARADVDRLLSVLPAPQRRLVLKVCCEGSTVTDAAADLRWTRTVASRSLSAALHTLRDELAA